jgi:serine/threonine-protein kinase
MAAPPPITPGSTIGEYEVVRPLGEGGMGAVFEAVHPVIGKRVAIKVLKQSRDESIVEARRLLEEARAVNTIHDPGVVDIFGAGVLPDGRPYLVMELLQGESLHQLLKRRGPLPISEVLELLRGIFSALVAAHAAGVIHRDLKTSNVFVTKDRRVKLLDFGVARRANRGEQLTAPDVTVGSLGFMSPEQMSGKPEPRSDLYSVGCIAWLLVVGQPVFPYKQLGQLARSHLITKPPMISSLRGEVNAELDHLIASLLEKEPAKRPASAAAALELLDESARVRQSETTARPGMMRVLNPSRGEAKTIPAGSAAVRPQRIELPEPRPSKAQLRALAATPSSATLPDDDDDDDVTIQLTPRRK